ncbi:MAG TPA: CapA family protein [Gemmatimonadaceae bacterium]|nr:CapA family protein [Gemmatimonadaceae bacterium]
MSRPITLVAVGDLQLGDSPTSVGYGFYSRYANSPLEDLFTGLQSATSGADILFGNLETTLVPPEPGELRRSALQLRGETEFAASLRRVGFDVLNVANNHAIQHGTDTFRQTVATLREAGIACCGVRGTDGWASEPAVLQRGGQDVGFLGYCLRPRQYGAELPPYAEGDTASICRDVERLRATGALVLVSLHWGEEFVSRPSSAEVAMAHAIIDAGAVAILGHHPHVTRPVERYHSRLIAYSLGNLIGDMTWYAPFRTGAILRCDLADGGIVGESVSATRLSDDYRPSLDPRSVVPVVTTDELHPLEEGAYERAIAKSMREQRVAAYRAAVLNIRRMPPGVLLQLVRETLRNKVDAVRERLVARPS